MSPTDGARERSVPKQDWEKMINGGGGVGNQVTNFHLFYYYLIRRKKGAIVSIEPKKRKKGSYLPIKACVVTDMVGL